MRTDFLANRCGDDGIVVIELKKSDQTARQAYTELLAYGSYLRTKFTPMSGGDIIYVLISPIGERIVEQAIINTLTFTLAIVVFHMNIVITCDQKSMAFIQQ